MIRHQTASYRWDGVEVHPYKQDGGTHFKDITRQTLLTGRHDLAAELRYFEIQAGGHSTLERHRHTHQVMLIRGCGEVLIDQEITAVGQYDIIHIPPLTWHQFRATKGQPLGFLCIVSSERDKPQRPGPEELEELRRDEDVAEFIRI